MPPSPSRRGKVAAAHPEVESVSEIGMAERFWPTAMQLVADVHETPLRMPVADPSGLAAVQVDPDRVSTAGYQVGQLVHPTATQAVDDVHETAPSVAADPAGGMGNVVIVQVLPDKVAAVGVGDPHV
jgi:hypothetical protein